ncbi:MAG: polysaccharide biosynthesis tyrosine autokinase [Planctomycetaceae bacterium]|nr:polysaccharide biosynthesis tyrosine autokinase [Planctomycetaceae bacterium]
MAKDPTLPPAAFDPPQVDEGLDLPIRHEELVVYTQPLSAPAEQYRRLRSSLVALNPDGAPRTILVTSAVEGEGKTVATLNLGLALAERPRSRILVVDADLRRPGVEHYLGLPRRQGLSEVLDGQLGLDQAIRRTAARGLDVIAAGGSPDRPRALNVDRMRSLLHQWKQRYDYVLIDSPPAYVLTDPSVLGAATDGILMVVRLGTTERHLVEETQRLLETTGGNVLGVCVLGAPAPRGGAG